MESFGVFGGETFMARHLLQTQECTQETFEKCFSKCPPQIPGPPPPPPSLSGYKQPWCTSHDDRWQCNNTHNGPLISGVNPRFTERLVATAPAKPDNSWKIAVGVAVPLLLIAILVILLVILWKRRQKQLSKKVDNTYDLGNLGNKAQQPYWTDHDGGEVTVEDGSEIFYQVDRSAFTAGMNGGANPRNVPDIINSSSGTLRKSPQPPPLFDLGRSGSATSQAPLLASPEIMARSRRRTGNRTTSEGPDGADSELGSPTYTRFGAYERSPQQVASRKLSHDPAGVSRPGYMTHSPNTKSNPSLYNGVTEYGTTVRTPKTNKQTDRQRSFSGADRGTRPRPARNPSAASDIQRSDGMTLNRAPGGRENYRNNWDNFDQVTATMRRDKKNKPVDRQLVLGTDSFIESFTSPEQEEATSVDQLGLPGRNPMLAGFYGEDDVEDNYEDETAFGDPSSNMDFMNSPFQDDDQDSSYDYNFRDTHSPSGRSVTRSPNGPPSYDDIPSNRPQSISMSAAPTLDLRGGRRDRISEYDSDVSIEV